MLTHDCTKNKNKKTRCKWYLLFNLNTRCIGLQAKWGGGNRNNSEGWEGAGGKSRHVHLGWFWKLIRKWNTFRFCFVLFWVVDFVCCQWNYSRCFGNCIVVGCETIVCRHILESGFTQAVELLYEYSVVRICITNR